MSKSLSKFLRLLFSLFLFSPVIYAQQETSAPPYRLAFISDTQAPMWIETLWLKKNHNEEATRILMNHILTQNFSALNITGDVVNLACNDKRWKFMDSSIYKIRASGTSVHACLGNHEVMKCKKRGLENFQTRFPDHSNTGYVVQEDSIAVVFFNSNFSKMNTEQKEKQKTWYIKTITGLDTSEGVRAIIVCCHHSPFTDSKVVKSSVPVQEDFVPAFIQSKKCRLFVSGHAHMFEHFNVQGKDFMVIGGGGGLNQPLKKGNSGQTDVAIDYKPMFHYLTVSLYADHLKVTSHKLKEDFSGMEDGLSFDVPVAR